MSLTDNAAQTRSVNAFFDTQSGAQKAVDDLVAAGIPRQQIDLVAGRTGTAAATEVGGDMGFWDSLKNLFLPDEDRYSYAEGLRRGGFLLSVRSNDAHYDRVLDILDADGAVDMDERETSWRKDGWTGFQPNAGALGVGGVAGLGVASTGLTDSTSMSGGRTEVGSTADRVTGTRSDATADAGRDETISLYEEQLRVGKRDVSHGRVRLRSYVVETPVSEQVSLRNETVQIDRKAVDRPVNATDAMFQDRVIEAEERAEEAVVSKQARVTEEISLRKTTENRTQTVSDSVRRTEVEIEDDRGLGASTGASRFVAATDSAKIVAHMPVISADGQNIGTVDHLDGPNGIKLAKSTSPDGQHHHVPFAWIDHIDQHVHLNKTLADIKAGQ